jgi:hypothetical protein
MTGQERDYEAALSRVLHTTTDQLEPVGDGLTKIRARLSEPWLKRQWWLLRSELMVLYWFAVVRCESLASMLRSRSAPADPAADPLAPLIACSTPSTQRPAGRLRWARSARGAITAWVASMGPGRGHEDDPRSSYSPVLDWLRPALAVAGAVVLVVAGVFAVGNIHQGLRFIGLGADGESQPGTSSQTGANGNTNGGATAISGPQSGSPAQSGSSAAKHGATAQHKGTASSSGPCPQVSPLTAGSPSATPTDTPTPTETPTPTDTPTPTVTPTPTPSGSNAPVISGVPGSSEQAIRTTALVICQHTPPPSPSNQATFGP